jgi:hypothetical protein
MKNVKLFESFINEDKILEYKESKISVGEQIKDDIAQILEDYFTKARIMEFLPEEYDENPDCGVLPNKVIIRLGNIDAALDYSGEIFEHEFDSPIIKSKRDYIVSLKLDETPNEAKIRRERYSTHGAKLKLKPCDLVFSIILTPQDEKTKELLRTPKEKVKDEFDFEENRPAPKFLNNAFFSDTPEDRKKGKDASVKRWQEFKKEKEEQEKHK